ncbi:UDP-4-keto-6-deoxy-N-acetylglucosamine 4-aminotransferase [Rhizobium leguminosarum bv. trifolii WSM2297]|uniref:UDP-4-keto-6-deoxy-N-acetylglucosamine 4-aminotransferase n=1 Tax=Rhizobium leguminosarum bv. trifolii WSM2297 TaxID=754762 RepID=J0CGT2_RHILT|nr:UDP-4-amino-4,6-dideoxy-N-acetyl-beta-L-altrosamine transaminase [Rhizobium leguminosarum]EJC82692.1 UDP-4-keto-6-deoxy-N-acetylglucosamine 4-aminotransferase [Rhizobium leguminosarum bv. trifolii WSM2297]
MIPYGRHHIDESDIKAVADLLRDGFLTQGPMVSAFENAVAAYTGSRFAVAVSSATSGLHLAAAVAGAEPGTALVTSPITFVASANAALYNGAAPLFADIDPATVNIDPAKLKQVLAMNSNVKAVMPVHYGGLACDMAEIRRVADGFGVSVIEDAAHALGGNYPDGGRIGNNSFSDMTVFSFHPVKAIAAGEGGMITTNSEDSYKRLLRLRSHGINKLDDPFIYAEDAFEGGEANPWYYEMLEVGYNYRITDIQCALGLSQFKKLDRFISRRRQLAKLYDDAFSDFKNLRPAQPREGRDRSGLHIYVVRIDFEAIGMGRGELMRALRARNIGSQVHYIPVTSQPYYRDLGFKTSDYPNSADFYGQALSIPLYFDLSDDELAMVIEALRELVG